MREASGGGMERFGVTADGRDVGRIVIGSDDLQVAVLTHGAMLQSVRLRGVAYDLTLGSDMLADYEGPMCYFGALVGPVANRLTGARAPVAGVAQQFVANEAGNLLHSGPGGMHARIWEVIDVQPSEVTLGL